VKGDYSQKNSYFSNSTLTNKDIWIILHDNIIDIGQGKKVSLANRYLMFNYTKYSREHNNNNNEHSLEEEEESFELKNLKYIRFFGKFCENVKLNKILIQPITFELNLVL